jgi:hypothetical protein
MGLADWLADWTALPFSALGRCPQSLPAAILYHTIALQEARPNMSRIGKVRFMKPQLQRCCQSLQIGYPQQPADESDDPREKAEFRQSALAKTTDPNTLEP